MGESKKKYAIWLTHQAKELVEQMYPSNHCKSQSEFIEKAIFFYAGYLNAENDQEFLPEVLSTKLVTAMDKFGDRISSLLYKVAIEQNMCNHILAEDTDMDTREYQLLRGRSVREVQSTNGRIAFKDALDFQKTV